MPSPADSQWRAALPDELKAHPGLQKFKDVATLAKSYIAAEGAIGADKVVLPGRNATEEQRRTFFTAIGCPEAPEKYELPKELPPDFKPDQAQATAFFKLAHEIGLTPAQAQRIVRFDVDRELAAKAGGATTLEQERTTSQAALRQQWGNAYDENVAMAKDAVRQLGGDELVKVLDETGIGNVPSMVKAFAQVGRYMREDQLIGAGRAARFAMGPAEAKAAIAAKERDPEFRKAYYTADHAAHAEAVKEMAKLHEAAFPEPPPQVLGGPGTH